MQKYHLAPGEKHKTITTKKNQTADKCIPRNNVGDEMSVKDVSKDDVSKDVSKDDGYLLVWFCAFRQRSRFCWTHVTKSDGKLMTLHVNS